MMRSTFFFRGTLRAREEVLRIPGNLEPAIIVLWAGDGVLFFVGN